MSPFSVTDRVQYFVSLGRMGASVPEAGPGVQSLVRRVVRFISVYARAGEADPRTARKTGILTQHAVMSDEDAMSG